MQRYKIEKCPFCGSTNLGEGYQSGYAAAGSVRKILFLSIKVRKQVKKDYSV